jgi:hypothetical protein
MKRLGRGVFVLLATVLALGLRGEAARADDTRLVSASWDLDATAFTYPLLGDSLAGIGNLKTTGSSATIDAATGTPFVGIAEGDELTVYLGNAPPAVFVVAVRTSDTQVTAQAAQDLSGNGEAGFTFSFRHHTSGTTTGFGWFDVSTYDAKNVVVQIDQAVATGGIQYSVECKASTFWSQPVTISAPAAVTSFPARVSVPITVPYSQCRVGYKIVTGDDGGDLTTNREAITTTFQGHRY